MLTVGCSVRPHAEAVFRLAGRAAVLLAVLATLVLAGGCGFQPRAETSLPPALAQVFVTGVDRDLAGLLRGTLVRGGAVAVAVAETEEEDAGAARIDLPTARFTRTTLTTDPAGRASAYALRYEVVFRVTAGGATLLPAQTITMRRAYDYAPTRQLHSEEEAAFLKDQMRREAAARILRRLMRL